MRFTNLGVLTINALKVSKCFTFLFAAVPMCFHAAMFHMAVSFTCFFFVTFLNFLSRVHLMYLQGGGEGEPLEIHIASSISQKARQNQITYFKSTGKISLSSRNF